MSLWPWRRSGLHLSLSALQHFLLGTLLFLQPAFWLRGLSPLLTAWAPQFSSWVDCFLCRQPLILNWLSPLLLAPRVVHYASICSSCGFLWLKNISVFAFKMSSRHLSQQLDSHWFVPRHPRMRTEQMANEGQSKHSSWRQGKLSSPFTGWVSDRSCLVIWMHFWHRTSWLHFLLRSGHLKWLPSKAGFGGGVLDEKGEERAPHIDFTLYSHCPVELYHGPKASYLSCPTMSLHPLPLLFFAR